MRPIDAAPIALWVPHHGVSLCYTYLALRPAPDRLASSGAHSL
jgi:hypothetical protein